MVFSTFFKQQLNGLLSAAGLKVDTLTADRRESERLARLRARRYFDEPNFPIPACIRESRWSEVVAAVPKYAAELERLRRPESNAVGFSDKNPFFHSPDSDMLYTILREHQPARVVEIGCGNSTRVMRQAILDGGLATQVTSIDPQPRLEVTGFTDELIQSPVEDIPAEELAGRLNPGDVLFIDSSHMLAVGNDCVYEYLQLVPRLKAGTLVHVHDILLPYDYPWEWISTEPPIAGWSEQYLLHAMLMFGDAFEVLWPAHYVQRTTGPDFARWFPHCRGRVAGSFWMRRR
jgi:predicted O-methyltransferase YrrM